MTPTARATAFRWPPTSRFAAALCASALAHLAMPLWVSGGGVRSSTTEALRPALTVRVVPQQEVPVAEPIQSPTIPEAPTPAPRVVQRIERDAMGRSAPPQSPAAPPGSSVPDAPDLNYYPAKQLDVYPKLLSELDLDYRRKHADQAPTGRALLLVLIDAAGAVNEVSVVEAEPANVFEDDVQRALMAARFAPAYRNGRAVRSRVLIAVNYGVERGSP